VRQGRREEFAAFGWEGEVPDPQDEATFQCCRLDRALARLDPHRTLREFYRTLLALRKQTPALADVEKETLETMAFEPEKVLLVRQWSDHDEALLLFHFASGRCSLDWPVPHGEWRKVFDSADRRWAGPGSLAPASVSGPGRTRLELPASSFVLYQNHRPN